MHARKNKTPLITLSVSCLFRLSSFSSLLLSSRAHSFHHLSRERSTHLKKRRFDPTSWWTQQQNKGLPSLKKTTVENFHRTRLAEREVNRKVRESKYKASKSFFAFLPHRKQHGVRRCESAVTENLPMDVPAPANAFYTSAQRTAKPPAPRLQCPTPRRQTPRSPWLYLCTS